MRRLAILVLVLGLALAGCSSEPPPKGDPPVAKSIASTPVGAEITVTGKADDLQAAHAFMEVAGKRSDLFQVEGHGQIVVYVDKKLPRGQRLALTGTVLETGKAPPGSKAEGSSERQLDVKSWKPAS